MAGVEGCMDDLRSGGFGCSGGEDGGEEGRIRE